MASVPAVAAVPPPARSKLIKSETGIVPMNDAKLYGQTGEATGKNDPVPDLMPRDSPLPPSRLVCPPLNPDPWEPIAARRSGSAGEASSLWSVSAVETAPLGYFVTVGSEAHRLTNLTRMLI